MVCRMTTTGGRPDGYHTFTTRIVVADIAARVAFLRATFDAEGDVVLGARSSFVSVTR
jgi:4-diphosphocytidyl-2C-methyl-D-erythritol kinase